MTRDLETIGGGVESDLPIIDIVLRQEARQGDVVDGSMLIIQINRPLPEISLEWLLSILPDAPAQQLRDASLVLVADPNLRLAQVLKCEAQVGQYLEMHTSALG